MVGNEIQSYLTIYHYTPTLCFCRAVVPSRPAHLPSQLACLPAFTDGQSVEITQCTLHIHYPPCVVDKISEVIGSISKIFAKENHELRTCEG